MRKVELDIFSLLKEKRDLWLFALILFIGGMGLYVLHPASSLQARIQQGDADYYFVKQLAWALPSVAGLFFFAYFPLNLLRRFSLLLLLGSIVTLVLVFVPGIGARVTSGTESFHRWVALGPVHFQPSEFAKITLLLYAAHILSKVNLSSGQMEPRRLVLPGILVALVVGLILIGPQYGTTICTIAVLATLVYLSGFPMLRLLLMVLASLPLLFLGITLVSYRQERFQVWLDPYAFRHAGGYQLVTAFRAFAQGGFTGTEIGTGFAHRYLTYGHTDFVLALFAEDFGILGIGVLFAAYAAFVWRSTILLSRVNEPYPFLLGAGCLVMLTLQSLLNIAVVTGLVPTTGVSLPFFSYGGSSLVASFCMAGLLLNAAGAQDEKK